MLTLQLIKVFCLRANAIQLEQLKFVNSIKSFKSVFYIKIVIDLFIKQNLLLRFFIAWRYLHRKVK